MRVRLLVSAFLLAASPALGSPILGPVYPPTTGVTLTSDGGSMGRDAGRTLFFDITDFSQVDDLYWGLLDNGVSGPLGTPYGGSGTSQTFTYSGTTAEGAIYMGTAPWMIGTGTGTVIDSVRLVVNVFDYTKSTNLTSSLIPRSTAGIAGSDVVFPVTADFAVQYQFQAFNGTSWDSVLDVFDSLQTSCDHCVITSTNAGFWYTEPVPEPASMVLFGAGLLAVSSRARRRGNLERRRSA